MRTKEFYTYKLYTFFLLFLGFSAIEISAQEVKLPPQEVPIESITSPIFPGCEDSINDEKTLQDCGRKFIVEELKPELPQLLEKMDMDGNYYLEAVISFLVNKEGYVDGFRLESINHSIYSKDLLREFKNDFLKKMEDKLPIVPAKDNEGNPVIYRFKLPIKVLFPEPFSEE